MKKLFLLAAMLMMGSTILKAQDTIVLRNGDELKVKVTEVNDTELKYKMWNNQDGPTYTKKVADIFMVKYKGGNREVYGATQPQHTTGNVGNNTNYGQSNNLYNDGGYMEHSSGDLVLNGRKLNSFQVKEILGSSGYNTYSSALSQRRVGTTNIIMGWIELGVGAFLDFLAIVNGDEDFAIFGSIFLGVSQIQLPVGYVFRGIGTSRLNWLAESYNNGRTYSDNFSIGFTPTLVCAPDAAGNRSYGLGAGVSLHF